MSRQRLASTAAMIALIAGLAMPAMAQVSNGDLPAPLAALNLNNLRSETGRDGIREVEGLTADGVEIEAQIDMAGNLLKVDADDGALPAMLIEALVPQAVRDHEAFGLFVRIDEIKQHAGHIEIEGRQANGEDIEAIFDPENRLVKLDLDDTVIPASLVAAMLPQAVRNAEAFGQFAGIQEIHSRPGFVGLQGTDGTGEEMKAMFDEEGRLLRFGRDEDKGPRAWRGRGGDDDDRRRGPERQMWRDGADMEQQRGAHMRPGGGDNDHQRGTHMRPGGPDRRSDHAMAAPDFDAAEVNRRLSEAGYDGFGFLRMEGPRILLEARNPQGEPVTLQLDRAGEVIRETAR